MGSFVLSANLPKNRVKTVIIGKDEKVIEKLNNLGINSVILQDNFFVDDSVKNHSDISAFYFGNGKILLDKGQSTAKGTLEKMGFTVWQTREEIAGKYPSDIRMNSASVGEYIICRKKYTDEMILNCGKEIIDVKQGYAKCSVCPVNEKAIITDDRSIYEKTKNIFDVLLIEKGDIYLKNKNYGFIGGSCGKISSDTLVFFGDINTHRNAEEIKVFLNKHNVNYLNLFDGKLRDIGGFLPIEEY